MVDGSEAATSTADNPPPDSTPEGDPDFGVWLRQRRLARGLSQKGLAKLLGYQVASIRKIEQGIRQPSPQFLMRVSQWVQAPPAGLSRAAFLTAASRLPTPATSLVGRDEDAAEVVRRLDSCSRLTLLGAPGIGKTRLAIEAARRLENQLANGACFVPLARLKSYTEVPAAIVRALHPAEAGVPDPVAWLHEHLRAQELLIVLDNCEHVLQVRSFIGRLLDACPKVRLLATSREPLGIPDEAQHHVTPLSLKARKARSGAPARPSPAVELFAERARLVQPDFVLDERTAQAVTEICTALDGLPFAIELAAGHMGLFRSPASLLADLGGAVDLPIEAPTSDLVHFVTLRSAIDWSYQLLPPELRAVFDRVGVFQGPFSNAAGAAVALGDPALSTEARKALSALQQKSLLESKSDELGLRFGMLESMRHFALDRLKEQALLATTNQAHAAHYLALAEAANPHLTGEAQAEWLFRLEREQSNVTVAIEWTLDHDPAMAMRLLTACWRWLWVRGRLGDGRRWFTRALSSTPESMPERTEALNGMAVLARSQGDIKSSRALLSRAATLARARGDTAGLALTLLNLAIAAEQGGELAEAETLVAESLSAYREVGDRRGVGHSLNVSGNVAIESGYPRRARPLFEESLAIFRELGDEWSAALPLANLGWLAYVEGEGTVAHANYLESAELSRSLGDERGLAHANMNLARVDRAARDLRSARERLEEVLLVFYRIGEQRGLAEALEQLAFAIASNHLERAVRLIARAKVLRQATGAAALPDDAAECARTLDKAAAVLGSVALERLSREGRVMSLPDAVAHALGGSHSPAEPFPPER